MIYDCHAHLVSDDFERYPVAPLSGALDRKLDDPMTAEKLLAQMNGLGIARAVAVQRAHVYGYNNDYVCDVAARHPDRFTAVCCIDAQAADAGARARYWLRERRAVGLRLTEPYKGANLDWFAGDAARPMWREAAASGASVCLHMYRWNRNDTLAMLPAVLDEFTDVTVVLDHASNLSAEAGAPDHGVDAALIALERYRNVVQKVTTINLGKLQAAQLPLAPLVQRLVAAFGAERVMWGSDVSQSPGSYQALLTMGEESAALLNVTDRAAYLGGTCQRLYGTAPVTVHA